MGEKVTSIKKKCLVCLELAWKLFSHEGKICCLEKRKRGKKVIKVKKKKSKSKRQFQENSSFFVNLHDLEVI